MAAHGLKGALATVGVAARARLAAAELERIGREGDRRRDLRRRSAVAKLVRLRRPSSSPGSTSRRPFASANGRRTARKAKPVMKKILIVDDDRTTRHVLQRLLTGAGYSDDASPRTASRPSSARGTSRSICCSSTSGCRA